MEDIITRLAKNRLHFSFTCTTKMAKHKKTSKTSQTNLHLRGDPDTAIVSPSDVERDDADVVTSHEKRVVSLVVDEK